jgi:hypothetical protein
MNIELDGLNAKHMALCDIMWAINSQAGVERFISTLPEPDQQTCRSLIELMQLAFADEVTDLTEATQLLLRF